MSTGNTLIKLIYKADDDDFLRDALQQRELLLSLDNGESYTSYRWHKGNRRNRRDSSDLEVVFRLYNWASDDVAYLPLEAIDLKRLGRLSMEAIPRWIDEGLCRSDKEIIKRAQVSISRGDSESTNRLIGWISRFASSRVCLRANGPSQK